MPINGSGQSRPDGGKFKSTLSSSKLLNDIAFLAESGKAQSAPALFIDGKFTSGQNPQPQKRQCNQRLNTEITRDAAGQRKQNPANKARK
jgi:hypothetical protein